MANTVITKIQTALNTNTVATATLAVADTADLAEVFEITPTKSRMIILLNNTASAGAVTFSLAKGTQWASTAALTGSIAQATSRVLELDTAKYVNNSGVLTLTVTPASGAKLKTGNVFTIQAIQLV
jgi:hypothetical protein